MYKLTTNRKFPCVKNDAPKECSSNITETHPYVRPSKLVTCLNDDGCFEGVPSLATVLASFEAF